MYVIDLESNLLRYNLADIYIKVLEEEPALADLTLHTRDSTNLILGRYFVEHYRELFAVALCDNARVFQIRISPYIHNLMRMYLVNEQQITRGQEARVVTEQETIPAFHELNLHADQYFRPAVVEPLMNLLEDDAEMRGRCLGELVLGRCIHRLDSLISLGHRNIVVYASAALINYVTSYKLFILETE